jgi:pyruvate,water dikinase
MHVLDVNSGLSAEGRSGKTVHLEHIRSQPMRKLFEGLASPAVEWNENILHYDWDAYAKSSGAFVDVEKSTMFSSYAIVDMEYLHALLRFGYHFAVLDTVLGLEAEQNYIHFSFKGGGGNEEQRYFRLQLISRILTHFHFNVKITADLLEAAFDRRPRTDTGANLYRLGIVLGKTVLLDMRLKNEADVRSLAESIIQEVYGFFTVQENS